MTRNRLTLQKLKLENVAVNNCNIGLLIEINIKRYLHRNNVQTNLWFKKTKNANTNEET